MKHIPTFENFLNEGDMTNYYDGFILLDFKTKKNYKFKYVKGTSNVKVEDEAIAKVMKDTGGSRANFAVHGFVKKGEWDKTDAEVLESYVFESLLAEGAMSDIDLLAKEAKDFKAFVITFKKEYSNLDAGNDKELEAWLKTVYDSATNEASVPNFSMLDYSQLSSREQQLHGELSQIIFKYKNLTNKEKLNAVGGLLKRIESGDLSESIDEAFNFSLSSNAKAATDVITAIEKNSNFLKESDMAEMLNVLSATLNKVGYLGLEDYK